MAKNEIKYLVQQRLSESEIKSVGGKRWTMQHGKVLLILAIAAVVFMFVINGVLSSSPMNQLLSIAPAVILLLYWLQRYSDAGRKFWEEVGGKQEPIDLG